MNDDVRKMVSNITITDHAFLPLISGHILNAYYSALLLKKGNGIEINAEIELETMKEVMVKWTEIRWVMGEPLQSLSGITPPAGD